ncbi:hypothetical protein [Mycobacterium gastri]|uniref:Uncharacterized protein n=1 Tax=Mycobacterium gastri TaxID=1777 RepID=A0A1X1VH47_MYCGS|nr:hypothetical protein [Mycobacterium gastri]ETW24275.1 hypothetical protein MGAST_09365 [Mycobacterium gastri 'Wayne']ORV68472.1 hypothetical protein AWC07_08265 [Mycobacterium gastri]
MMVAIANGANSAPSAADTSGITPADGNDSGPRVLDDNLREALTFDAPYVLDRLLSDRVVETRAQAEELFTEVKKYLVLSELSHDMVIGMYSEMVDAAWHAFILFTSQYADYGHRYFGHYLSHAPTIHSGSGYDGQFGAAVEKRRPGISRPRRRARKKSTFTDFRERYETLFGQPLPYVWHDIGFITVNRRMLVDDRAGPLTLALGDGQVSLFRTNGTAVLSVNDIATAALQFIIAKGAFYVRELPGGLTDDEKIGLAQALVRSGALKVAP